MNISPINVMNCKTRNNNLQNSATSEPPKTAQPSFSGLWGESTSKYEFVSYKESYYHDTHFYYPFFDETPKQIKDALASKTYTEDVPFPVGHDYPEVEQQIINKAVKKDVLPFAECEWKQYAKDKFAMLEMHRNYIEEVLKKFKLEKYIK